MRGASALQSALERAPDAQAYVMVVWEPVLVTDIAPPSTAVLGHIADTRAAQFWDGGLRLSKVVRRMALEESEHLRDAGEIADARVVWDVVAVFPPGVRWEEDFPPPADYGFPVYRSIGLVERFLADASAD